MQKIFFLFISLFLGLYAGAQSLKGAQSLSGNITDSVTHQPIDGAAIYFPQLQTGALTDISGNYKISSVPKGTYEVEVQMLGYNTLSKQVDINGNVKADFVIAISAAASKEVIITALGNATTIQRAPVPITMVSHEMLLQHTSTNVVDAIATQPGITAVTTGPGVSKPEINGLGYNRVLTLFDGARQEDFQWGDEHGILIDPYAVYDAEIIRGAASLQYGANAVAGVVSFKSQPPPPNGVIRGSVQSEYQTNNGLVGNTADIAGNNHDFIWDVRGSYETTHCYTDPHDGYVWGTAYNQANARAVFGVNKKWGYSRLTGSFLRRQIEIPDGNRDSATGQFEFDIPRNAEYVNGVYVPGSGQIFPDKANFLSYKPDIAGYQILDHSEVWWQNSIEVGRGTIGADIGYTQSTRHEIDTGTVASENMVVNDIPYSFKYQLEDDHTGIKFTTGINGMYEFMKNGAEPPSPYVGDFEIPNYHLFDIGGYGILQEDYKNLTVSGGVRYDLRTMSGQSLYLANYDSPQQTIVPAGTAGAYMQFPSFNHTYNGVSGSLGASYQLPKKSYIKINVAKSYRAPAINELTANELDPANVYKLGDPNLKAEQGYEVDLGVGYKGRDVNLEVDGFYNYVQHFIFPTRLAGAGGGDSVQLGAPVYKYTATTAMIAGATAYLNIHPAIIKWLEIDNGFTYIYSLFPGQSDSTRHIPFTPAPRLTSSIKFKLPTGHTFLRQLYIEVGLAHYWAQNDIYSALYNELPSTAYTLFDAGVGTNFVNPKTKKVVCSLFINCTNLANLGYLDHTSREQYFWAYNGVNNPTNFGATAAVVTRPNEGIYNMGRNIGIKVVFPIGIVAAKN